MVVSDGVGRLCITERVDMILCNYKIQKRTCTQVIMITKCSAIVYRYMYSKTSDSGHSEIGTQYNKPLNKGHSSRSQIIGFL